MLNPYAFDGHYMVYHGLPSITYWKTGKKTALFPEPEFVLFLGRFYDLNQVPRPHGR
jgi:hypothetical protein